ncbi:MAG TPA: tetratricopeptide repeat protein [Pyrinomonadaceae bacterium]|jgi:DNA-binding winged helix-turn-helix (wHTH) protein/Flp pilus assembly protein TadD|nr:tetratricopeptide repeat protein [Pyrinomonadaceae bacterium]
MNTLRVATRGEDVSTIAADEIYKFGDYILYGKRYLLTHRGKPISLPSRLFDTLLCLLKSAGTPVAKDCLIRTVWPNQHVSETNITRALADLRRVLKDYAHNLKTITGVGYCFIGSVERITASQSPHLIEALSPYPDAIDGSIQLISVLPFHFPGAEIGLGERCATATATELSIRTTLPVASPAIISTDDPLAVAAEVSHLLVGYVYAADTVSSVQVHLSRLDGRIIWATQFSIPSSVEDKPIHIARQICRSLENKLRQPSSSILSANSKAVQLHGRALFHWKTRTVSGLRKGLEYAEAALEADPSFAQAYVTAANYYCALVPHGDFLPSELLLKARESALRALELDPDLADAHVSLGIIKLRHEFDRVAAEQSFKNAAIIDPRSYTALHWLGNLQCTNGQFAQASETLREAYELNPESLSIRGALAQALFLAGDLRLCREWLEETLELNPTFATAEFGMGMLCGWEGDKRGAIRFFQQAAEHSSGRAFYLSSLAYGASKWGDQGTVKSILKHLDYRRRRRYVPHYDLAVAQLANGNLDRAVQSIARAISSRDALAPWLGVDPRVQDLHSSPRFIELLGQVNFPSPTLQ